MDLKEKIQYQINIITRFDNLYNAVNNKGNFLITFHSFIIGAVILGNNKITDNIKCVDWKYYSHILLIFLVLFALISICLLLTAMYPYEKSGNDTEKKYHSLIFYKSISELEDADTYLTELKKLDEAKFYQDLTHQSYQLAKGLCRKFSLLAKASIFIYIEGLIVILILLIILFQ